MGQIAAELMTERAAFSIPLRLGARDACLARHSRVWPEMLRALEESGWTNFSIYVHPANYVIGYFEADNIGSAIETLNLLEVNARWQRATTHLFDGPIQWMPLAFNLEEQLHAVAGPEMRASPIVRVLGAWRAPRRRAAVGGSLDRE